MVWGQQGPEFREVPITHQRDARYGRSGAEDLDEPKSGVILSEMLGVPLAVPKELIRKPYIRVVDDIAAIDTHCRQANPNTTPHESGANHPLGARQGHLLASRGMP